MVQHPLLTYDKFDDELTQSLSGDTPQPHHNNNNNSNNDHHNNNYRKRSMDEKFHGNYNNKPKAASFTTVVSVTTFALLILLITIVSVLSVKYYEVTRHYILSPRSITKFPVHRPKKLQYGGENFFGDLQKNQPPTPITNLKIGFFSPSSSLLDMTANLTQYQERVARELRTQLPHNGASVMFSAHSFGKNGMLSGTDEERLRDFTALWNDVSVHVMIANRGGWGCSRLLDLMDFSMFDPSSGGGSNSDGGNSKKLKKFYKIIMGHNDVTSCLNGIFFQTGMITFHGAMGHNSFSEPWNDGTPNLNQLFMRKLFFDNEKVLFQNPGSNTGPLVVLRGGKATGRLVGGNLSSFVSLIGSNHLPPKSKINLAWEQVILFFEDLGEDINSIDQSMTQLQMSGILSRVAGFVFGICSDCRSPPGSQSLQQVLRDHVKTQPAVMGLAIGNMGQQFILPIGARVELDADRGTIQMLENALSDW